MRQRLKLPVARRLRRIADNIQINGHFRGTKAWVGSPIQFNEDGSTTPGTCCLVLNPAYHELSEYGDLGDAVRDAFMEAAGSPDYVTWNDTTSTFDVVKRLNEVADQLENQT